jgi:hypothetical protein
MNRVYTLPEANAMLPLLRAIAAEIVERRARRRDLVQLREQLESARTPEGLTQNLAALDAEICEQDEALRTCRQELEDLGLAILRQSPLTIHIVGRSRSGPVVFCWQEGEQGVNFGHALGEEEDHRRPLRIKAR